MDPRRAHAGVVARAVGGSVLAFGAGAAAGAVALGVHFARRVLTPATVPLAEVEVTGLESGRAGGPDRVRLRGPDAGLPGRYSFIFAGGTSHARLGPVLAHDGDGAVWRELLAEDRGRVALGARGRVTGWWYTDPAELGYRTTSAEIRTAGGSLRAWLVEPPAERTDPGRWAIHVHGRGALPEETIRGVAPCARAGITSLVISYRNDPGAPRGRRGRYGLGLAERLDVEAAIAWARARGARRVTLVGWSMGGTASLCAAAYGPHAASIDGLVLDSPAVDWPGLLRHQARLAGVPAWVGRLGGCALQTGAVAGALPGRRSTPINELTPERFASAVHVPVLIHAGPDDTYVPWDGAVRFARLRPALVTLRSARGEHVKLWNVDPEAWEAATEAFVRALPEPRERRAQLH